MSFRKTFAIGAVAVVLTAFSSIGASADTDRAARKFSGGQALAALERVPDELLDVRTSVPHSREPQNRELRVRDGVIGKRVGAISMAISSANAQTPTSLSPTLVGFDNGDGSWFVPMPKTDGSFQVATVISGPAAPEQYRFALTLPANASVRTESNGTVSFWDSDQSFLGAVAPAWAVDQAGRSVPTRFAIQETTLVQFVDHNQGFSYPVVADPWLGKDLFTGFSKTTYKNEPRYNFSRTGWGRSVHTGLAQGGGVAAAAVGQQILKTYGWSELKVIWPAITDKASLKQQFDCHVVGGYFEAEWNLERSRPNKSNWLSSAASHKCNWS